jgi:hypothetical protein
MPYRYFFLFSLLMMPFILYAQVPNDDIEKRLPLALNEPVSSNTIESTVQWNCLNQDLTRSCIKFHNDQWFEFRQPAQAGPLFINVFGQDCKDIWGVQVVIFSGVPCQPETYELITCYSKGNKDDIFIRLPELEPGETYLVNVDGYLHDLCQFAIEWSDQPRGLPVSDQPKGSIFAKNDLRAVTISWEVLLQAADRLRAYEVWRRAGDTYELVKMVDHMRNSFGDHQLVYEIQDSLNVDQADYMIVGVSDTDRWLIGETHVKLNIQELSRAPENRIDLELSFRRGDPITIELWDMDSDERLDDYNFIFDQDRNSRVSYGVMRYREQGINFFKVIIRNNRTGESELLFFEK